MKTVKKIVATLSIGAALLCGSAHAALANVDWKTPGDNSISKDTATELGWLDLTATQGLSINQVLAQMGSGGQFAGFRLPTTDEIFMFMSNIAQQDMSTTAGVLRSVSVPIDVSMTDAYGYLSNGHVPMLGYTHRFGITVAACGFFLDSIGQLANACVVQRTATLGDVNYVVAGTLYTYSVGGLAVQNSADYVAANRGIWLVKDLQVSDVNSPIAGFALAVMLLLIRRRARLSSM